MGPLPVPHTATAEKRTQTERVHLRDIAPACIGRFRVERPSGGGSMRDYVCVRRCDREFTAAGKDLAIDWVYDRPIVSIDENETASDALVAMYENHSSCAIVKGSLGEFMGMLDLLDVVRYILRGDKFDSPTVRRMLRLCVVASETATLSDVCAHLRAGNRHVAIAHPDGNHQIISQRAVACAVQTILGADVRPLDICLRDACLPSWGSVICAWETWTARQAFESMVAYDITSLPVCDEQGRAIDVISASDILHTCNTRYDLEPSIRMFKERSREHTNTPASPSTLISCAPEESMMAALEKMLTEKIHHVYVLDTYRRPVAVVSFVDVLRQL